jgi:uncharacterized protein YebE (UPF0316 family)
MVGILTIFFLNVFASGMKVMNTMFISRKIMKPVYLILFVDAIIFTYAIKVVTQGGSFYFIFAFALGRVVGAFIADKIENKMAIGILEVTVFTSEEKGVIIADTLRSLGYWVSSMVSFGVQGKKRITLDITVQRKELALVKEIFAKYGYTEASMVIRELKTISGKLKGLRDD